MGKEHEMVKVQVQIEWGIPINSSYTNEEIFVSIMLREMHTEIWMWCQQLILSQKARQSDIVCFLLEVHCTTYEAVLPLNKTKQNVKSEFDRDSRI